MGKKANAGRFERGYLKVTTEKSYQLDFARTRKAAENQFLEVPFNQSGSCKKRVRADDAQCHPSPFPCGATSFIPHLSEAFSGSSLLREIILPAPATPHGLFNKTGFYALPASGTLQLISVSIDCAGHAILFAVFGFDVGGIVFLLEKNLFWSYIISLTLASRVYSLL